MDNDTKTEDNSPRTPLHLSVEYRKSYAREGEQGVLKNISLSGAFLEASVRDVQPTDKLTLVLKVSGRKRKINASVIWKNELGAGIEFDHFNNRDLQIIDDLIYFVESSRNNRRDLLEEIFKEAA